MILSNHVFCYNGDKSSSDGERNDDSCSQASPLKPHASDGILIPCSTACMKLRWNRRVIGSRQIHLPGTFRIQRETRSWTKPPSQYTARRRLCCFCFSLSLFLRFLFSSKQNRKWPENRNLLERIAKFSLENFASNEHRFEFSLSRTAEFSWRENFQSAPLDKFVCSRNESLAWKWLGYIINSYSRVLSVNSIVHLRHVATDETLEPSICEWMSVGCFRSNQFEK